MDIEEAIESLEESRKELEEFLKEFKDMMIHIGIKKELVEVFYQFIKMDERYPVWAFNHQSNIKHNNEICGLCAINYSPSSFVGYHDNLLKFIYANYDNDCMKELSFDDTIHYRETLHNIDECGFCAINVLKHWLQYIHENYISPLLNTSI